jgi:signal-transduction protein with cAMP-binding, CBS, and nucleotidyltransferase domain
LTSTNEEIVEYLQELDKESKALRKELLTLCWFMRGSISYDEAMMLSYQDRELINEIIKNNMETTEKSGLPFF